MLPVAVHAIGLRGRPEEAFPVSVGACIAPEAGLRDNGPLTSWYAFHCIDMRERITSQSEKHAYEKSPQ